MQGYDLIRAERIRQVHSEGYKPEKDVGREQELAQAAQSYVGMALRMMNGSAENKTTPIMWPWEDRYWKPSSTKRNMIKAGALIAAAIDALPEEQHA